MRVCFVVAGSTDEPYDVVFNNENGKITASCSCLAGVNGQHCKHRLALLGGDSSAVLNANSEALDLVRTWVTGSDLEKAFFDYRDAEKNLEEAKSRLMKAKKKLGKVMAG